MDEQDKRIPQLLRDLRGRVPMDAAALLADEDAALVLDLLRRLPSDRARRIARHLEGRVDWDTGELPASPPGSLQEITEEIRGVVRPEQTVAQALDYLRTEDEARDVTYLYVVDGDERLQGLIVIRDLLRAAPEQALDEVMLRQPFHLLIDLSVTDAIKAAVHRHYPVYPVCDEDGRLVGLVPGFRLFERQAIEITAQSGQMVGVGKEERVDTPVGQAFRKRHPWLQLNLFTAFAAAFVVGSFEETIAQVVALAAFLPVLAGQAGNTGCQAQAITLRGLTLGQLKHYPASRLLRKEAALGLINGVLTGAVAGLAMWWFADDNGLLLAGVILMAMVGSCMASGVSGVLVPLGLKRLGADPATASTIFLTTATDVVGMGLMLLLATALVL